MYRSSLSPSLFINADAMQIYTGMDVITNKVPLDEQEGVEHLLMGYKKPGEQYVVGQWVKDAIQAVCFRLWPITQILNTLPQTDRGDS